jgi:zinc protease
MQSIAYDWHSYGRTPIGNRSDIENVGIANLQAFYRTWYQPDNAVLLVAGKFDPVQALDWISQSFGKIPRPKRSLPTLWTVEPTQDGERSFTVRRQGDLQIVAVGYKIPAALHPDSEALRFSAEILATAATGRLHKELVETGKATDVFADDNSGRDPGLMIFGAVLRKGENAAPVAEQLVATIENFSTQPVTEAELERVRRNYLNQMEKNLNDPQEVGVALSEAIALGDWRLYFAGRERVEVMTGADITAAAGRYFRRDNRVVGHFLPDDAPRRAEIPASPEAPAVLKTFKPGNTVQAAEAFEPTQANIMKRTRLLTVGGLKLALLPKKNRGQSVAVDMRLHWGNESNLAGKVTIQSLTQAMLARGTSKYTREQLSDAFDALKVSGSLLHFETTRSNLADALRLVAHVLKEPSFPAGEFEQLRQQSLVALEAGRSDPETVAGRLLDEHYNAYPKGDPRAVLTLEEEIAAIKAARLEDVKAFHQQFYGASRGELAIVGDFDADAIPALVNELFGSWPSKAAYAPLLETIIRPAPLRRHVELADKENGVVAGRVDLDLNVDDADYPALMLANQILGGGALESRLMRRLRQKEGLSYGGGSALSAGELDRAGTLVLTAIAAPQNLDKAQTSLLDELVRARAQGFSAAELGRARHQLLQERARNRAEDGVLASAWTHLLHMDKTFEWSAQFERKLQAVTLTRLNEAWRKAVDPATLSVVTVGLSKKATKAP